MSSAELERLRRLANRRGVETDFVDVAGTSREACIDTLRAMIDLLGRPEARVVPPVLVSWNAQPKTVRLNFRLADNRPHFFPVIPSVSLEDKVVRHLDDERVTQRKRETASRETSLGRNAERNPRAKLARRPDGSAELRIPALPFGYYDLGLSLHGREHRTLVISAPMKAFAPGHAREWGVFLPMYAAHSHASLGTGDFESWQRMTDEAAGRGATVVSTLPLLASFLDEWKTEPSPYSPASRLFWNEFYIDVMGVPELNASATARRLVHMGAFQRRIARLRRQSLIDYRAAMSLKRSVLEPLAATFFLKDSSRRREFDRFVRERPEVASYAEFRAACERRQQPWASWPERMRNGILKPGDYCGAAKEYHLYVQWLAQEQMSQVLANSRARGVKLYLDLPLGVNPDGYDVWRDPHSFVRTATVGAPPDAFFTKGQNWGFPPLHPERIRESGYRYVIDYLRFQMRHTGMLRLDHIMGLHRLWWIPPGASAREGAYVRYHAQDLYAILCLESHRHQTMLVGENLGTVPPRVNVAMKRHGIRSMFVAQYEQREDGKLALRNPPRDCVAGLNTHDMPTWAAHWAGADIEDRRKLGLITRAEAARERRRRGSLWRALEDFLRGKACLTKKATAFSMLEATLKFLARSEAEVVLVNAEDLWLEKQPQNVPGTSTERPNWRRKTRRPVENMLVDTRVAALLEMLKRERQKRAER